MKRIALPLLALALPLIGYVGGIAAAPDPRAVPVAPPARNAGWWSTEASQLVFFAVLEGLYRDGVTEEIVSIVIPLRHPPAANQDPVGQPYRDTVANFVYTCPLCHPTAEAFLLYASRKPFFGQKGSAVDTFGPAGTGIPADTLKKLRSEEKPTRLQGVKELIDRWVKQRLDLMRLTDKERADWEKRIAALREEGNKALATFQKSGNGDYYKNAYADWKFCPSCDGSFGACKLEAGHK